MNDVQEYQPMAGAANGVSQPMGVVANGNGNGNGMLGGILGGIDLETGSALLILASAFLWRR